MTAAATRVPEEPDTSDFDYIERAIADIAAGRPVVVVDDGDRENEGDLIFAAAKATPELLAFMIRHTSGVVCVPMEGETLDRLELPLMTDRNGDRMRTAFTVTADARCGVTTGISAADRAHTIRTLVDSATEPHELTRPGHVFPLRYRPGGVLRRRGHTEAAVDLSRLAGLAPAGVLCEVVNDDGTMARLPELRAFAAEYGLSLVSIADLVGYRRATESLVRRVVETRVPNQYGVWRAVGYAGEDEGPTAARPVEQARDGSEHLALVYGDVGDGEDLLVRIHSECLTGDVFGSLRCDCGAQLEQSMAAVAAEGRGVVVYLRGHEGRGIGLLHKLRAYQLQDSGVDTVDANLKLGLPADARDYAVGSQILRDLGVRSLRLLSNNPEKAAALAPWGLRVHGRVGLPVAANEHNARYLQTKRDRMGHDIPELRDLPAAADDARGSAGRSQGDQAAAATPGPVPGVIREVARAGGAAHLGKDRVVVTASARSASAPGLTAVASERNGAYPGENGEEASG